MEWYRDFEHCSNGSDLLWMSSRSLNFPASNSFQDDHLSPWFAVRNVCLFSEILIRHAAQESGYWTLADFWSLVASLSHQLINRGTHILTKWMGDRNRPLCFFCLSRPNDFLKCCIFKGSDKCPHFAGWKYCMYGCRCFPISGWWFQTFFIFHNIRDNPSHWLIFFKMVETTNQIW